MVTRLLMLLMITALLFSCNLLHKEKTDKPEEAGIKKNWKQIEALKNIDREFSAYCRDSGMKKAYFEFFDENGVMLRPDSYPLAGADALDFLSQIDDAKDEMSWQVLDGDVAASDDLGYTYGIYFVINKEKKDTVQQGTYTMFWKKQKNGDWKFVMDSGSPGLGEKNNSTPDEKHSE